MGLYQPVDVTRLTLVPPVLVRALETLFRVGCQGEKSRPVGSVRGPVTRSQRINNLVVGNDRETMSVEGQNEEFKCVCGKVFSSAKGRNIHRGKKKCSWRADESVDPGSVNSRESFSPDLNHSAEDISRLLTERHGLEPPPARKERINWPKSTDKAWEEFDLRVSLRLKEVQKNLRFQERMKSHCDVVYEEGVKWFGVKEVGGRTESVNKTGDRRAAKIVALVRERRDLRKSLRRAQTELEREGFKALIKVISEKL